MNTTLVKRGLIAGLLLISTLSFAERKKETVSSPYLNVKVTPLENKWVSMKFQKLREEKVKIAIYDQYGTKLHEEKVLNKTSVLKKFDMTAVPAGMYSFEVSNDIYLMKRTVEVK
ncbi:hypothetical protein [Reichenbachiella sp. MALMAid0571]|uniref:hypothetical protein n=1 Tax=Reichenbachiella sp. MALMAid0571 TaxID=3143939 RepID=UPI0032DFD487